MALPTRTRRPYLVTSTGSALTTVTNAFRSDVTVFYRVRPQSGRYYFGIPVSPGMFEQDIGNRS